MTALLMVTPVLVFEPCLSSPSLESSPLSSSSSSPPPLRKLTLIFPAESCHLLLNTRLESRGPGTGQACVRLLCREALEHRASPGFLWKWLTESI